MQLNFLAGLTPNQMMMLGAAVFAAPIALSNEAVKTKLKSLGGGALTSVGNWWKSLNKTPVSPDVAPSPTGVVIDSPLAVHQVVTPLMAFFARSQDGVGVQLAGAVGQHMYDHSAKWMTAPAVPTPDPAE